MTFRKKEGHAAVSSGKALLHLRLLRQRVSCFLRKTQRTVQTCITRKRYPLPWGNILLSADEVGLTGLWFDGGRYYAETLPEEHVERETPILMDTKRWLDVYFTGREPDFTPPLHPTGSPFRQTVWQLLLEIPYGQTTTYGELAKRLECGRMSAQAVGGAVGHNPISIIVPCHRVVGTNGSLTGYAGGLDRKIRLLEIEQTDMHGLFRPKKGTAI